MITKQIIQSSANVIRITNLAKGNIYKRFDDNYTYYGVVRGIHNDGIKTIIESTEYRDSYGGLDVSNKIFKGETDISIFPATLDEFEDEFGQTVEKLTRKIIEANETIEKSNKQIEFTKKLMSGELSKELSTPEFKELTQEEFNHKIKELN